MISHRLWRQRFDGANDVVGRRLTVQRFPFTIIGVTPPTFFGPDVGRMADVMLPFAAEPLIEGNESRLANDGSWWLQIMVRLKPGQRLELCRAMSAVHDAGLLHRDVKTHNVMRAEDGRIVLTDFGAGREFDDDASHDDRQRDDVGDA